MKKNRQKMSRDVIPQGFTLGMALVDALPVVFFGAAILIVGLLFSSPLFLAGAILSFLSGLGKVIWKIIVALKQKNVWFLFVQMRILMPVGFLLMLLSLIVDRSLMNPGAVFAAVCSMPALLFFLLGCIGMGCMVFFAIKLDSSDAKSNWIEQGTNAAAQASFLIGLLILLLQNR